MDTPDRQAFEDRVRLAQDEICPALGRIPIDLVTEAVRIEIGEGADQAQLHLTLRAIAVRNAITIRPLGLDPALT